MLRFLSVGMFAVRKLSEFYGPIAPRNARALALLSPFYSSFIIVLLVVIIALHLLPTPPARSVAPTVVVVVFVFVFVLFLLLLLLPLSCFAASEYFH